jgi:hypothetical protein
MHACQPCSPSATITVELQDVSQQYRPSGSSTLILLFQPLSSPVCIFIPCASTAMATATYSICHDTV